MDAEHAPGKRKNTTVPEKENKLLKNTITKISADKVEIETGGLIASRSIIKFNSRKFTAQVMK